MTNEELEKKLNELSTLKKQLDEITEAKVKTVTSPVFEQYEKEAKHSRIRLWVGLAIGLISVELGVVGINSTGPFSYFLIGIGILGLYVPIAAKLGFVIKQSKLAILQEMKQLELRIIELSERVK